MPFPALERAGVRLRRGQTSMTVAAPGVGKSQLWANLAHRCGAPTLYWSADTDQHDVTVRSLALWSGKTAADIDATMYDPSWQGYVRQWFDRGSHIEWVFEPSITAGGVADRVSAFAEKHGEYPHLVVVDNLSNTVQNQADEYAEQKTVMAAMQRMARDINAHVAMLHHAKGEYDSGMKPIPQSGSLNNMFKLSELGLTMYRLEDDRRRAVNVVKNRGGQSDPAAKHPIFMDVDFAKAQILGWAA